MDAGAWSDEKLLNFLTNLKESGTWTTPAQWWRARQQCGGESWVERGGQRLRTLTFPQLHLVTEWLVDTSYMTSSGQPSRRYQLVSLHATEIERTENEGGILAGMYVRCPFDNEYPDLPRQFIYGHVEYVDNDEHLVRVRFFTPFNVQKAYEIPNSTQVYVGLVRHSRILAGTMARYRDKSGSAQIQAFSHESGGYYYYFVHDSERSATTLVCEADLLIPFNRGEPNPLQQLKDMELQNPKWYRHRRTVEGSLTSLQNATFGFQTLLGSRVILLPHQVDTIARAVSENPCRFMLADEVGLGKTIEASVIVKGLRQRFGKLRTLILAPEALVYQWKTELSLKFWIDVPVWHTSVTDYSFDDLIFPIEKIDSAVGASVLSQSWDVCIVDEAHRLVRLAPIYNALVDFSSKVNHFLLLSATPIQERREEYLKLLILLYPQKYLSMSAEKFSDVLDKQDFLRDQVHRLVRSLDDYVEYDLADEYIEELAAIAAKLQDPTLSKVVSSITETESDKGLNQVKLALAYISEHYQFERKIIRHRRFELEDKLPKRRLTTVEYALQGSDVGFYEAETYEALLEYLNYLVSVGPNELKSFGMVSQALSAFFSSPWALSKVLDAHFHATGTPIDDVEWSSHEPRDNLIHNLQLWQQATQYEFDQMDALYDDPELIKGRLLHVIDILSDSSSSDKFVVFTSWRETLVVLEPLLIKRFGSDAVRSFYFGKTDEELQQAADDFQKNTSCRFMLCDELGGEGRNFQHATKLLHVDLPWSPVQLEQRIGRLDRIGREDDVVSIVFVSEDTVEHDLFTLWDTGLRIFDESLSGLEIALGDIQEQLAAAVMSDVRNGLRNVRAAMQDQWIQIREAVEKERFYDVARQLDEAVKHQLAALIHAFDDNGGHRLSEAMMAWANMTGLHGVRESANIVSFTQDRTSFRSMANTLFVPPDMAEARKRARNKHELRGTFDRSLAVRREDLIFFGPGDPLFDAIVGNAIESPRGTSCAYMVDAPIQWTGFVFTWAITVDVRPLLKLHESVEPLALAQGYVPLEPYVSLCSYSGSEFDCDEVLKTIDRTNFSKVIHLGKRGTSSTFAGSRTNLEWLKSHVSTTWISRIDDAYEGSLREVRAYAAQAIDTKRAERDFQARLDGLKASHLYFGENPGTDDQYERTSQVYRALVEGLRNPAIRLQSVAFVQTGRPS